MAEKKEFSWDKETLIKTIEISEYERREVRICKLKDKEYVVFTTVKKIKGEWKPVGGYSLPKAHWVDIVEAVNDHAFHMAFGGDTKFTVVTKPEETKKTRKGNKKEGAK